MNKKVDAQKKKVEAAIVKLSASLHALSFEMEKDEEESKNEIIATLDEVEDDDVRETIETFINSKVGTQQAFLTLASSLVELVHSIVNDDII